MISLAPNVDLVQELLTSLTASCHSLTGASYELLYTHMAKLDPDPAWLGDIRKSLAGISNAADEWVISAGPTVITEIPQDLITFGNHFADFVKHSKYFDKDEAIRRLQRLQLLANPVPASLKTIQGQMDSLVSKLSAEKHELSAAIDSATAAAAADQKASDDLAKQISDLRQKISGETEDAKNALWGVTSTSASVSFTMLAFGIAVAQGANPAFPFMAVIAAVAAVTASSITDAVKESEIADQLGQIGDLQVKLTKETQQIAAIKTLKTSLHSLLEAVDGIQADVGFKPIWDDITKNLSQLLSAVQAPDGNLSTYQKDLEDAATSWKKIVDMSDNVQMTGIGSMGSLISVGNTLKTN